MPSTRNFRTALISLLAAATLLLQGCVRTRGRRWRRQKPMPPLVPIKVAGARWIELSPVIVAANSFYPQKIEVPSGGVVSITSGAADLATNAETQLLRESIANPDLRIVVTVSESFYRLVARRSAGISEIVGPEGQARARAAPDLGAVLPRGHAAKRRPEGRGRHDRQSAASAALPGRRHVAEPFPHGRGPGARRGGRDGDVRAGAAGGDEPAGQGRHRPAGPQGVSRSLQLWMRARPIWRIPRSDARSCGSCAPWPMRRRRSRRTAGRTWITSPAFSVSRPSRSAGAGRRRNSRCASSPTCSTCWRPRSSGSRR